MIQIGLERLLVSPPEGFRRARAVGLLCNQASVDRDFRHAADLLHAQFGQQLAALFGPQHGLWSTEQDNMVETAHAAHPRLGLPVHSLYAEVRQPTPAMLQGLDLMVVDLQDVGTRVYTYVWTLLLTMRACAALHIPVLVLDRPNPIGGSMAEGALLQRSFQSFVGLAPLPMRHGLTLGELALHLNASEAVGCDLQVLAMRGWKRPVLWPGVERAFVPPSPNLPRYLGALVYPGQVLLEGTNLSEGRGTTTPFEQFGAPWLDPWRLLDWLQPHGVAGCALRPVSFQPTFHKFAEQNCGGLFVHPIDPTTFRPYRTTLLLLRGIRELWPQQFAWRPPPYEYENDKLPIDILCGDDKVRQWVDGKGDVGAVEALAQAPADWFERVQPALLY